VLEISVSTLAAGNNGSESINITNSVGGLLTIGTVDGLAGVANADTDLDGGDIEITNSGPITVDDDVSNTAAGDIILTATDDGGDNDHLIINARLIASGGSGAITLNAGTDLTINDSGSETDFDLDDASSLVAIAEGDVLITADVTIQGETGAMTFTADNADGSNGGVMTMNDTALIDVGAGTITITAAGDITLGGLKTADTGDSAITISTATGAVQDGGNAYLEADVTGRLVIDAVTGVGQGNALEIDAGSVNIGNSISGDIDLVETDTVTVISIVQAAAGAAQVVAGTGITVDAAGVVTTTTGDIKLTVQGGAITMTDGATITTGSGDIELSASTDVTLATISSVSGTIDVAAGSGASVTGAITDATAGEAANITAVAAVTLTAETGIGAAGDADIDTTIVTLAAANGTSGGIVVQETDTLTIAAAGIQIAAGAGDVVITVVTGELQQQGDIDNDGTGSVMVTADDGAITMTDGTAAATESGDITYTASTGVALSSLTSNDGGDIAVTAGAGASVTGAITDNTAAEAALLVTEGTATLTAETGIGHADDIDTTLGSLAASTAVSGDITIQETDGLIITGTGVSVIAGGGDITIDVLAGALAVNAALSTGGSVDIDSGGTMAINSLLTATGSIDIDATTAITINAAGGIDAGDAVTFGDDKVGTLTTAGDILTSDDQVTFNRGVILSGNVDIDTTGTATGDILFAAAVDTAGNGLTLDAGPSGDITLQAALTGGGDLTVRSGAVQSYQALTAGDIDIQAATASVTFNGAITASGNVNVDSAGTILLDAPATVSGTVDIDADGLITIGSSADIDADGAVTFGADREGELLTAGDILTHDDDVTFNRAVTLAGDVLIDTTGTAAGDILFSAAVDTDGYDLTLDAGPAGNITLADTLTAATLLVRNGAEQSYASLELDVLTIQDATTTITFDGTVDVRYSVTVAGSADIALNAGLISYEGTVSITGSSVAQNTDGHITINGSGSVDVAAEDGSITMADGTTTTTDTGAISYSATIDVALSVLTSTSGAVDVTAGAGTSLNGAITDSSSTEDSNIVSTGTITLGAESGIGGDDGDDIDTTIDSLQISNNTRSHVHIQESDGLIITGTGAATLDGNGDIKIGVDGGDLTVNSPITAHGRGDVLLNVQTCIAELNAAVTSGMGDVAVTADSVQQNTDVSTGSSGDIALTANNGEITMISGTTSTASGGDIIYRAASHVFLSMLAGSSGGIGVTAGWGSSEAGTIHDNLDSEESNLVTLGTATLIAETGIGAGGDGDIDTSVGILEVENRISGGIYVQEADGLLIGEGGVRNLDENGMVSLRVNAGYLSVMAQAVISVGGDLAFSADSGSILQNGTVSAGANLDYDAGGAIIIKNSVVVSGNVTIDSADTTTNTATGEIQAGGAVTFGADKDGQSSVNGDIYSKNDDVTFIRAVRLNGNVLIDTTGSPGGDILFNSDIDTGGFDMTLDAGPQGDITMLGVLTGGGDLTVRQGGTQSYSTMVLDRLDIREATTSVVFNDAVNVTGDIDVNSSGTAELHGAMKSAAGDISIIASTGLAVNGPVTAQGSDITLNTETGGVELNSAVASNSGVIVITGDSVSQNSGGNISTGASGTVTVAADGGAISMSGGTVTTTDTSSITYKAAADVMLSLLTSMSGDIYVTAGLGAPVIGAISDNLAGEGVNIVTKGKVSLTAETGIGARGDGDLNVSIGAIEAANLTSGDIYIQESEDLMLVGSGVMTLIGDIAIDVDAGALTVNGAVTARGSDISLNADNGAVVLNAPVTSSTGIVKISGDSVSQNPGGNITTGASGAVVVTADSGTIAMTDGSVTITESGEIEYIAVADVALSVLASDSGVITVTAGSDASVTGAITDNLNSEAANIVTTGAVILTANTGIGSFDNADIDVAIRILEAVTHNSGGIYINEENGVIIGPDGVKTLGGNGPISVTIQRGLLVRMRVVNAYWNGEVVVRYAAYSKYWKISLQPPKITLPTSGPLNITFEEAVYIFKELAPIFKESAPILSKAPIFGEPVFEILLEPESYEQILSKLTPIVKTAKGGLTNEQILSKLTPKVKTAKGGLTKEQILSKLTPKVKTTKGGLTKEDIVKIKSVLSKLSGQQQTALLACYNSMVQDNKQISITEAYETYSQICAAEQIKPLSPKHFFKLISTLLQNGLINISAD